MDKIIVQKQDFDPTTELDLIRANQHHIGAIVSFIGTVRDLEDKTLTKMALEHYPAMTQKALESIATQAKKKWDISNVTIIHRIGELSRSDKIVLVITTSKHRTDAFKSCEFIIDYLKTNAPFWKKEHTKTKSQWVKANNKDTIKSNQY